MPTYPTQSRADGISQRMVRKGMTVHAPPTSVQHLLDAISPQSIQIFHPASFAPEPRSKTYRVARVS